MANTSVFTGADGSITLSTPQTDEGTAAQTVIDDNDLVSVGRVQSVEVIVDSSIKPFHEIGQRYATQLRPGNVDIHGTIGRAYVNGALLRLLLGEAADGAPGGSWTQPAFNITMAMENAAVPGVTSRMTLHDVKIDSWTYSMPEDDFVLEGVSFKARTLTVEDEAA